MSRISFEQLRRSLPKQDTNDGNMIPSKAEYTAIEVSSVFNV